MLVTIAHNEQTGKYHPFVWYNSPAPSEDGTEPFTRFKSKMHHTGGFETEEEARAEIPKVAQIVRERFGLATIRTDAVIRMTWGPNEVPAAVQWMEREP